MKKSVSLFIALLLLLSSALTAGALSSPYAKNFQSKESMIESLSEYAYDFPCVEDYYSGALDEERAGYHLEGREVIIPYVKGEAYSATEYAYAESTWGSGVDYTFTVLNSEEVNVRVLIYYNLHEELIEQRMLSFVESNPEAQEYSGSQKGYSYDYVACEYADENGASRCEYMLNFSEYEVLVCVYTNAAFDEDFFSKIKFERAGVLLPVFVEDYEGYNDRIQYEGLFFQEFYNAHNYYFPGDIHEYKELYYHYDEENNIDWALICTSDYLVPPWEVKPYAVMGDRVLRCGGTYAPFVVRYGIYDVAEDKFKSIVDIWESDRYENLQNVLTLVEAGELIGDTDKDGELTVKDATNIQKYLVGLEPYPEDDTVDGVYTSYYGELAYISDFNRDGERNVKDATAIQKYIAGLDF